MTPGYKPFTLSPKHGFINMVVMRPPSVKKK